MIRLYAAEYASVRIIQCSPPSWMAHILLLEKQLDHQLTWLSFAKAQHKSPSMLALNPRGTIPVLVDGDVVVHETMALLHYLEDTYPKPALLPPSGRERAMAITRFHEAANLKDVGMALFVSLMRQPEEPQAEHGQAALTAWGRFRSELEHWERYLADSDYVAGRQLTLADICVYCYLATALRLGLDCIPFPNLAGFSSRMLERPSVRGSWPWPDSAAGQ